MENHNSGFYQKARGAGEDRLRVAVRQQVKSTTFSQAARKRRAPKSATDQGGQGATGGLDAIAEARKALLEVKEQR